ncbi:MAG: UPF0280 family protein [Alphaproteobacteria bacterium]|nr:UPF0280 family protein [Alphaproteobacteria bacterium]MDP6516687.1 UPF0280 family protein [Alphaproteobacteria bacterium]
MTGGPRAMLLAETGRLHMQHGPIDIIAQAFGAEREVWAAYRQAVDRFQDILETLVGELDVLRSPIGAAPPVLHGPVARRMAAAVWAHRREFITPMAAVAGAVADDVLATLTAGRALSKAYVNNGGDIAFHLAPGQALDAGLVADLDAPARDALIHLPHHAPVRGLATSGWRGRSLSLGIADSVTVLAATAAGSDAAATLIANAVTVDHPGIERVAADQLRDDTDLGARPVTARVARLPAPAIGQALDSGARAAEDMSRRGLIGGACLILQGSVRVVPAADSPRLVG